MKKSASNTSNRFALNFSEGKIVGTKASFDKASKGFGPIYDELVAKMAAHPDYKIEITAPKRNKERQVYHGMDIPFMRDYIAAIGDTKFSEKFEKILTFAENADKSKYPIAKKFFLKHYTSDNKVFNFDAAKDIVLEYRISKTSTGQDSTTNNASSHHEANEATADLKMAS